MIKLIKEIILNIDSLFKILWFSFAMCLKSKKSPSITISKKGVFWQGIFNFNIAYWIRSHQTKFCHYSLKSSNFNFCQKLTFFLARIQVSFICILCRICHSPVAIERPLLQFYVFPNISSKHNLIHTKFCTLFSGFVYEIGTKNQLNVNITFKVIVMLSHT